MLAGAMPTTAWAEQMDNALSQEAEALEAAIFDLLPIGRAVASPGGEAVVLPRAVVPAEKTAGWQMDENDELIYIPPTATNTKPTGWQMDKDGVLHFISPIVVERGLEERCGPMDHSCELVVDKMF